MKKAFIVITIFTILLIATSAMAGDMGKSLMKDKAVMTGGQLLIAAVTPGLNQPGSVNTFTWTTPTFPNTTNVPGDFRVTK